MTCRNNCQFCGISSRNLLSYARNSFARIARNEYYKNREYPTIRVSRFYIKGSHREKCVFRYLFESIIHVVTIVRPRLSRLNNHCSAACISDSRCVTPPQGQVITQERELRQELKRNMLRPRAQYTRTTRHCVVVIRRHYNGKTGHDLSHCVARDNAYSRY